MLPLFSTQRSFIPASFQEVALLRLLSASPAFSSAGLAQNRVLPRHHFATTSFLPGASTHAFWCTQSGSPFATQNGLKPAYTVYAPPVATEPTLQQPFSSVPWPATPQVHKEETVPQYALQTTYQQRPTPFLKPTLPSILPSVTPFNRVPTTLQTVFPEFKRPKKTLFSQFQAAINVALNKGRSFLPHAGNHKTSSKKQGPLAKARNAFFIATGFSFTGLLSGHIALNMLFGNHWLLGGLASNKTSKRAIQSGIFGAMAGLSGMIGFVAGAAELFSYPITQGLKLLLKRYS